MKSCDKGFSGEEAYIFKLILHEMPGNEE